MQNNLLPSVFHTLYTNTPSPSEPELDTFAVIKSLVCVFSGLVCMGGRDDHFWKFLNMFAVCEKLNWEWTKYTRSYWAEAIDIATLTCKGFMNRNYILTRSLVWEGKVAGTNSDIKVCQIFFFQEGPWLKCSNHFLVTLLVRRWCSP